MRVAVLTVSDRSARGERPDEGGPLVERMVAEAGAEVVARALVPDEASEISAALRRWADLDAADVILTTGGTGFGPRDVTPEATRAVIDREAPGIAEAMRAAGTRATPLAALSRQVAGQRGRTLIVNLPGSPKAAAEGLEAILGILPHAVEMARGLDHPAPGAAPPLDPVIVTGIRAEALDAAALADRIRRPDCGGVVVFEGSTRSPSEGREVLRLEYEAYESLAERTLRALAEEAARRHGLGGAVAVHRIGSVGVGEPAVVVAAAAPHRAQAFAAARELIDRVKAEAPIWKKEIFAGGSAWAGPENDFVSDPDK